jgi:hypothetical protein
MANNKASDIIETALNEAIKLSDEHEEGDMLVEWIVVTFVANANPETRNGYPTFVSNGEIPVYRAVGLLNTGLDILKLGIGGNE